MVRFSKKLIKQPMIATTSKAERGEIPKVSPYLIS
jgi:hypothetical protein